MPAPSTFIPDNAPKSFQPDAPSTFVPDSPAPATPTPSAASTIPVRTELRAYTPAPWYSRALESTREFLSPVLGPTEQQRFNEAVPWVDETGNPAYVYKPLGSKADQQGLTGALSEPIIPIPQFKHEADDSKLTGAAKAVANTGLGFVQFFESPLGLATGGAATVVPRLVAGAFAGDMGLKAPEALQNFSQTTKDPNATFGQKLETTLGTAVNVALPVALGKAAIAGKPANVEARNLEAEVSRDVRSNPLAATRIEPIPTALTEAGLTEAPAAGTASPVERYIAEQRARTASQPRATAVPEPKPWEMDYGVGGEMPSQTAKFEGGQATPAQNFVEPAREATPTKAANLRGEQPSAASLPAAEITTPEVSTTGRWAEQSAPASYGTANNTGGNVSTAPANPTPLAGLTAQLETVTAAKSRIARSSPVGQIGVLDVFKDKWAELNKSEAQLRAAIQQHPETKAADLAAEEANAKRIAGFAAARDARVSAAPVYQRSNGWEIVKDGVDYVVRDPNTKQDVYRGKLSRAREVSKEAPPPEAPPVKGNDSTPAKVTDAPAETQKSTKGVEAARVSVDPKTDELLGTNNRGEPVYWSETAKTHYAVSDSKIRTAPWIEGLSETAIDKLHKLLTASPAETQKSTTASEQNWVVKYTTPEGRRGEWRGPAKSRADAMAQVESIGKPTSAVLNKRAQEIKEAAAKGNDSTPAKVTNAGKVEIQVPGYMNRPPEPVSGTLVKLKADPNHDYVAINTGRSWKIVERTTGLRPGETYAKTKAQAIAMAEANITKAGGPERMRQLIETSTKLNSHKPAEAPAAAVEKVQQHVTEVAAKSKPANPEPALSTTTGPRAAKEIKSELVQRLEEALDKAPDEATSKITIEIPGDGKFTILNHKRAIQQVLDKAKKLDTSSAAPEPRRRAFQSNDYKRLAFTDWTDPAVVPAIEAKLAKNPALAGVLEDAKKLAGLEDWADKQLAKDPRRKARTGLDPQEEAVRLAAVAIKGSYVIARGVRDFAQWSAEMVKQIPELAQASAEQLKKLYDRAVDIAEGRDPEIGLSVRGMKLKADTQLSDEVRTNTEAAYLKRRTTDDVAEARRLVLDSGGAETAARDLLSGLWKTVDFPVQVKASGEVLSGLAMMERAAEARGDQARANDLADLQVRVAEKSREMATTPAQWLQSFASLYSNYSPAAWLREWQGGIDTVRKQRLEAATGKATNATGTELTREIASAVAEAVKADAPKVAAVIDAVYGGKGAPGETATKAVERIIGKKGKEAERAAKKIQDFYEREVNKFKRKHKIPELTPEDQRSVLAEAKAIERLPKDSMQRREAVLHLLDSLHRRKGFEWWELPIGFWYANTLSGPLTHAKNILGNSVNLGMEAGLQAVLNPMNLPAIFESLGRSLSVGSKEAWSILRTGHDTAARHGDKFELQRNPLELQSGAIDKVLLPWKLVGRLLRAEDAVFFNAGQELRAAILARRAAGGNTAAMREAMGWTPEARAKAEAQAASEGLTGLNYQRRVNEIIEQGRPDEIMNPAREFGYDVTFNNEPYGVLGAFTKGINRGFEAAPILKPFILPFTRIVANVSNSSLNWTPVGTYRALRAQRKLGWLGRAENSGKLYGREINDPLAVRDLHAKALIGTAAVLAVTAAAVQNVFDEDPGFMVTGSGPRNKEQRDALRAAGWIPYSVKIGNRYYSYADKPPQLMLTMVGHYLDAIRYKNLDREDALNRVAYALNGNFQVLLQSSWLQGLSSLFNQASRDSVGGAYKGIPTQAARTASGFVVPAALKQLDQFFDPKKYSSTDVESMLVAQIPWARRSGRPDLNAFGQPIYAPSSKVFWSKVEGDKLTQQLANARVFPGVPNQGELTDAEYYALVKFRGPLLREALASRADEWMGAPRLIAQDVVNRLSAAATEQAKREMGLDEVGQERKEIRKWTTK